MPGETGSQISCERRDQQAVLSAEPQLGSQGEEISLKQGSGTRGRSPCFDFEAAVDDVTCCDAGSLSILEQGIYKACMSALCGFYFIRLNTNHLESLS